MDQHRLLIDGRRGPIEHRLASRNKTQGTREKARKIGYGEALLSAKPYPHAAAIEVSLGYRCLGQCIPRDSAGW
jgi:hypothetical protein